MTHLRLGLHLVIVLSLFFKTTLQASTPTDTHYTAGVVEFRPDLNTSLSDYLRIINSAHTLKENKPDIIVFPESTLNRDAEATFVPDPNDSIIPCTVKRGSREYQNFLRLISCAARDTTTYIVINLTEKQLCLNSTIDPRPCASNGLNIFNTNVVFDRAGRVISRYRKVHLYGEPKNTTYVPEFGIFITDFGVRFGHFVCYDLLFYTPAQEMVHTMGIKDFILTSMWFGQLPFLTGVQIQSSWAYANDVNLLAAGASYPATGTTGTGIYNGRKQPLVAVMNKRYGERKLYLAKVPKHSKARISDSRQAVRERRSPQPRLAQNDITLKRDYLDKYESQLLDFSKSTQLKRQVCFKDSFCCNFELTWRYFAQNNQPNIPFYRYRLGAYDGWRGETVNETNRIKNCAIFSCIGDDIKDCGRLFPGDTLMQPQVAFDRILIESTFPKVPEYLLMPNSLRENLMPLAVDSFQWNVKEGSSVMHVRYLLNSTVYDLLTFSIYGNYYNDETEGNGRDAATSATISMSLVAFIGSVTLFSNTFLI